MKTKTKLFLYGTLKKGHYNNNLLKNQEFVGEAITKPKYRLYSNCRFPMMVVDEENGLAVRGELWLVDDKALANLDYLEGTPAFYRRELVEVEGADEEIEGYIYNKDVSRYEECGDEWR